MGDSSPDNSNSANTAPPAPSARRFWWLKRLSVAFTIFIGAVIAFEAWWFHEADRQIKAEFAAIRARGEPAGPEDFNVTGVPDAQNAALTLQAAATTPASAPSGTVDDALENAANGDFNPNGWMKDATRIVADFAPSLRLARQARAQPGVDWKIKFRSPVHGTLLPHLNPQRELAKVQKASARYHHAIGNDREAIETIGDMLNGSHVLSRGPSLLVVHLVGVGLQAMACQTVEQIAPDLQVDSGGASTRPAATRRQVLDLIADLLDEPQFIREAQRGWQGERMQVLDATRYLLPFGPNSPSNLGWWVKPAFELDGLRAVHDIDRCAEAAAQPNWRAARSMLPRKRGAGDISGLEAISTMMSDVLAGSGDRAVEQDFRIRVDRRADAIRLAIRLYRIDRGGEYPKTLDELVPMYLPAVPVDPYAADNRPMSYRAAAPFPAVWSVGLNGVDDGGTSLPNDDDTSVRSPRVRWECADIVYPLERIPPATQPSPETQNSQ
jgi:hypothetical protein